jgi:uncharacterized protein with HEPN domain
MRLDARKYLHDIQRALDALADFVDGKSFDDYAAMPMLRAAVERKFEITGEALNQLARRDERLAGRISDFRRIIAFRNILIHGYTDIDDRLVWDIVETKLPTLRREISELLREGDDPNNR